MFNSISSVKLFRVLFDQSALSGFVCDGQDIKFKIRTQIMAELQESLNQVSFAVLLTRTSEVEIFLGCVKATNKSAKMLRK